jgi:hypothetical protein
MAYVARRVALGSLLLVCLSTGAVAQTETGFEPVPQENLRDATLTVPEENFSVAAPGPQWQWLQVPQPPGSVGKTYVCQDSETGAVFLLSVTEAGPGTTEGLMKGILSGLRKSQEARGRRFEEALYQPAGIPSPGSFRVTAKVILPEGTLHLIGYVFAAHRVYMFQLWSEEPEEPEAFTSLVESFRLLAPAPPPPKASGELGSGFAVCLYVSILVVFLGLGALINAMARKPVISGGLVALILILIVAVLRLSGAIVAGESAERFGYYLGEALVPVAIAAWAHIRYSKKKETAASST